MSFVIPTNFARKVYVKLTCTGNPYPYTCTHRTTKSLQRPSHLTFAILPDDAEGNLMIKQFNISQFIKNKSELRELFS
jgi:hypothetical protein